MSTAPYNQSSESQPDPYERCVCAYCDDEYRLVDGFDRTFCSLACRYKGAAHGILETIRSDHRFCTSCFRTLKETHAPAVDDLPAHVNARFTDGDRWGQHHSKKRMGGFTGTEEPGEGYEWDVGEEFDNNPSEDDWSATPTGYTTRTKICECGVTHHATIAYGSRKGEETPVVTNFIGEETELKNFRQNLSKSELNTRADRLCSLVNQLHEEQKHDHTFDRAALFAYIDDLKDKLPNNGRDFDILERSLGYAIRQAP